MPKQAYHGGAFFSAIGEDFSRFERHKQVINADVLDAWFDPSPKVLNKIRKFLPYSIKTSPPTHSEGLIATIAKFRKIPVNNIVVAGGSSDIMFTFFPRMVSKDEKVLILDPMYGEYAHIFEHVVEAKLIRFKLNKVDNFVVDIKRLVSEIKKHKPPMVVLVNPNSPTGQYIPKKDILKVVKSIPAQTLVVVDETYIEYVNSNFSLEREATQLPNLAIIKSMSKVYGLSGARVGYLVANDVVINKVAPFVPPWSVSMIGQIAGIEALKDNVYYQKRYKETHALRETLSKHLSRIAGLKVYNSVANYILFELLDNKVSAEAVVQKLRKQNIFIRNCNSMSSQFNNRFIRVAVKDAKTNKKMVEAIKGAI